MPPLKQHGCAHQFEDEQLCAPAFRNAYRCDACGEEWTDEWSCMCNDKCPGCNAEVEPFESEEIAPCACDFLGAAGLG